MKNVEDIYPLTPLQSGMLFHSLMAPESGVYVTQVTCTLPADLDAGLFRQAWERLLDRHGVLRTAFLWEGLDEPMQVVRKKVPLPWQELDWCGLSAQEQQRRFEELGHRERHTPLPLGKAPLMRFILIRLGREHGLIWTAHHLLLDGWSLPLLVQELQAVYADLREGRQPVLPPVRPFSDYVVWLRRQDFSGAEPFWRGELAGFTAPNALGIDRPDRVHEGAGHAEHGLRISREITARLQALASRHKLTLPTVTLGAWAVLVSRYSGDEDVVFGNVVSGRPAALPAIETMVGMFINTLPVRVRVNGAEPLGPWLQRLQERQLARQEFEHTPLAQIQRWSEVPAGSALFETLHVFESYPSAADGGSSRLPIGNLRSYESTNYPVNLILTGADQILVQVKYDRTRIEGDAARRLSEHLATLLAGMAEGAGWGRAIAELPLLGLAERQQLLVEWNDTDAAAPALSVIERFERWADRTPDAVALLAPEEVLTYAELDARANRLARRLRALGVTVDGRVGLCAERSPAMIVAVLGILKAGAAYVPLDPAYPKERLAFMVEDARIPWLLTEERLLGSLPVTAAATVILDGDEGGASRLPRLATPDSLAYVIYTSGSTGRPKGVMIHHRGWSNLAGAQRNLLGVKPGDRVLQFASLSFDASASEIAMALGSGATLVLGPRERRLSREDMTALLRTSNIVTLPPTLLATLEPEELPGVETVIVAGEACPLDVVRRWAPGRQLVNGYGPTEVSVCAAMKIYDGGDRLPVGRPLRGTQVHLLDARGDLLPIGVAGELCVGGLGLARGYLDRPDRTAESFVPHPFATLPGERLYRTGDLALRRPDGEIEFLGRLDHQVKIRGFRVEPGEIEAALAEVPGVREAAVVAREDATGRRLVAYVTGDVTAGELRRALREQLRERLPDYMVPAAFVKLQALPLTPNGKVDRKALPAPDRQSAEKDHVAPRTPVEEVIAGLWSELLGLERVGANDHFFELGGHSLLATRVTSRLRSVFGVEVPLRDLFEAPRLADLAARIESMLRAGESSPAPPLAAVPREGPLPLSFAQQRLWFLHQLEPGSALYNVPAALRVEGPLDAEVLALCLGEIVRRHEALRTTFAAARGFPEQVIRPAAPVVLSVVDLAGLPERARETQALILTWDEAGRPFDLTRGPLLRSLLLRLGENDHVFALTLHHIVSDGWSAGVLVREVAVLYAAFAEGRPSPLPELPVQYADFAAWQRSWLQGEVLEGELSVWRRQLAGLPPRLELPTDRPRPAVQSFRGASRPVRLPAGLTRQMSALARREGATLFMVLLAGFQALLARASGQDDLAVGSPVAGRNRVEIEGLIGFFVNTLVLRGNLAGEPSFRELLGRVRETALLAHAHQDVPFERLVEALAPERSFAHAPLFQVMFVLQNAPAESLEIHNLRLRPVSSPATTAKFDLTLSLVEAPNGEMIGSVEHAVDLFDGTTIDRLILQYERLLTAALEAPKRKVSELPLLNSADRGQILREWNDTQEVGLSEGCLHQAVAAQAGRTPTAIAVELGTERWTYRRLVASARHLARHLRELGVGPDEIVGLCAERSPAMVVGMLGVLEAGGAYLPLDPTYPAERLALMLEDSGARIVLIQEHLIEQVPADGRRVVLLDARWDLDEEAEALGAEVTPDHLAYVIYTSGSTGRPKGVMVPHRGVVNRLRWAQQVYRLDECDAVLQKASFGFDFSVWECFAPLSAGARLVLAEPGRQGDGPYLVRALREHRVTFVHFVPSMLAVFLDEKDVETCTSLRQVFTGGEALTPELRDRVLARLRAPLDNQYGPTEISIDTARWVCSPGQEPHRVRIGRPIANSRLYVTDPELRPAPVGFAGELLVGGVGVTRGYLGQPALTAERFVPDPFSGDPGGRLYRTGDLARWLPDGSLDFLGRLDYQVKIRGFRIELGEIETALSVLPGVREAVVVAREDAPGDRRLVAYVAGDAIVGELRLALREKLPDYMVPAAFMKLEALPLNPHGKVDRKALPAPERQSTGASHVAPRTPVEEVLAGIWAELLGLERAGANDHFFDLGGHSLLATRVTSRLRDVFGIEMPLRDLFEAPRLADLAARIEVMSRAGASSPAPPLAAVPREGPLPLSFAQQRLWFFDQLEPGSPLYNIPVALRVQGPLDPEALARCLGEIVRRHEALRTIFDASQGFPEQVIQTEVHTAISVVDLAGLPERETQALALVEEEAVRPFDLARGPLLRSLLLRLGENDHVFALTLHHIVSDGWSAGVLVREVVVLYAAFSERRPSPLPELPVQYADFAVWQRSWLHGEVLEREIDWWRRQLAGLPALLELPTDRPRPSVQSFRGASRPVRLPAGLTRQMAALGRQEGATLFMILLAGFQALLGRYSDQDDLAVGSPVAGRNRVEIEGLIGCFVNTLVLRGDLTGEPSFRELLGRVREKALAAHTHQDVPFEKLVEELAPERSLAHAPLFQVMFVLQNAPVENLEIRDLRLRPVSVEATTAKFDLTLTLEEQDGGLSGSVGLATDLFDATTIERAMTHFERLLAGAVGDPARPAAELPLLSSTEIHQVRIEWNQSISTPGAALAEMVIRNEPAVAGHRHHCTHERFEAQVGRSPNAVALVYGEQLITYRELNRRANQFARYLQKRGVGPEVPVGLFLERTPELVIAILGIMKAGGAYVPLDTTYPKDRLAYMLQDSGVQLLLTQEFLQSLLPAQTPPILRLDADWCAICRESESNLDSGATPHNLAYILYTSGSTGRPKGVGVTHANLMSYTDAIGADLNLAPHSSYVMVSTIAADGGNTALFLSLCTGGELHILSRETTLDPQALSEYFQRHPIDFFKIVVSHFAALFNSPFAAQLLPRKRLILGGEALGWELVDAIHRLEPDCQVLDHYGPTETTVGVLMSWIERTISDRLRPPMVPPGRPLANAEMHILDRHWQHLPAGVAGELFVGGACVARGYLNQPDLTAERFVPNPWGEGRLYKTGDRVRHLPDGTIEFLGRIDKQVKIRGFRLELGEIEAALAALAGVRAVAVVAHESSPGDRRLVAYVAGDVSVDALRQSLQERLPDYMVPAAFVTLAALPLAPNGKVDKKALPAPDWQSSKESYLAPRTPVEEVLAGIWCEVLGLERVGVSDRFFDLGGHSLLATRVLSRVREAFRVELPLRDLFEATALSELAARIEMAKQGVAGGTAPPLVPVSRESLLPLSFAQERFWFLDQLDPGNPAYNIAGAFELAGSLDVAALAAALGHVASRHEVLRTVFRVAEGSPHQHILPSLGIGLPVLDLAGLPEEVHLAEAKRLAAEHSRHRFDLARGPLLDALLLRLATDRHHLLVVLHHAICDGWSLSLLVREIGELYGACAAARPPALDRLPVQYADFAVWQREVVAASRQAELAWWLDRLAGEISPLEMPTDRMRPAVQTYRGGRSSLALSAGLAARLAAFGRAHGATLFMTLLAAIKGLLHRHSGQDDVLVGAPVAGRRAVQTEGLIGCFLNTLVLRTGVGGDPGFRELVGRVREVTLGAYSHQDVPFEAVLASRPQQRDLSRTPLFQVMVNLLNLPSTEMALPGLALGSLQEAAPLSKLDMTFYLREENGVQIGLVYNADLFDAARMRDLLGQLDTFLGQALDRPDEPIGSFSLVTADARAVLPDPAAELSAAWQGAVHDIFGRHARQAPHALAVADPGESWSYGELDERADRLAAFLQAGGVRPGDVVAVWAHRSAPLVWGVLGVLKAGAAFLMLDPRYPAPRQARMLEIARPAAWLRVEAAGPVPAEIESALDALGSLRGACRLALPARAGGSGFLADVPAAPSAVEVGPDDLAYVAFTSGSTGVPKGVLGRHGSLSHFIPWLCRRFDLSSADRFSLLSGLAHDPLHRDLFTPLQIGAAVVIPDPETLDEPGRLAAWMREAEVTVAHLTPALGQVLTTEAPDAERVEVSSLRYAFLVGDVLTRRDVARLRRLAPAVTCVNYYGSTETQRAVGYHVAGEEEPREVLPLGCGIPDVQLLVLNPAGALAGIGELGEVSVRSPHIALGYLGDPQLTAQRFAADLYRTGDLGRYLPNGEAVFAGRADTQVKVRGFRIELGEIESVLGGFPGIREAIVIVRHDRGAESYLAAYVVMASGAALPVRELRAFLRERLPEYMLPATFTLLDELPLTPNRKVDRKALPAPEQAAAAEQPYRAPRTPVELLLADIWSEILGLEPIGVDESFFDLGGHSLLATRMVSQLRDTLRLEVPLRVVFEAPTVAELARRVAVLQSEKVAEAMPIRPVPRDGDLPLSYAQQRLWFLDRMVPDNPFYNVYYPVELSGPIDVGILRRSFREILRRHEVLRTSFVAVGGRPVQVIDPEVRLDLPLVDLQELAIERRREELARLSREEGSRPFDLSRGPMLRLHVVRLEPERHALLVSMHHIASDGWSMRVLIDELTALYEAFLRGESSPLPELPIQYADFAVWQRQWFEGELFQEQLGYWTRRLAGLVESPLELPTDHPRPPIERFRGRSESCRLAAPLVHELKALARGHRATLFMIVLSGFNVLLSRYSGQQDIGIGTVTANRNRREIEELIGFFVNTLVLRTDLSGLPSFAELLARVRSTTVEAYAHQDLPFEMLIEKINPERALNRHPLVQVMLAFQNFPRSARSLRGLSLTDTYQQLGRINSAKFDLSLFVTEPGEELAFELQYSTDLFEVPTIRRMLAHLERLLWSVVEHPEAAVSELPLLTEAGRAQVLREWSDTAKPCPQMPMVHELFAEHARRRPEAQAITSWDGGCLSYGEVEARANRLAHHLRSLGVGPDVLVGIAAERTCERVVGIVAVLKAGGAYVTLDPTYPWKRLAFLLDDARVPVLLTQERFAAALSGCAAEVLCLDASWESIRGAEDVGPESGVGPANLAYVVYTSGSTGKPKGVEIPHSGLMNLVRWHCDLYRVTPEDRATQLASPAFDASIWELWPYLASGASVHIPDEETRLSPAGMIRWWAEQKITLAFLVTPLAEGVLDEEIPAGLELPTRALIIGGDRLHRGPLPGVGFRLMNHYGPSEYSVTSTVVEVPPRGAVSGTPTIGRAVNNTRIYLLERSGEPVGIGVPGELYVAGLGLARGYHRRPDLTAETFVPDPFAAEPGERMYRTGDLVRWLPDGDIDFLGRLDHQVKVRGFRIELGEIETVLTEHPAVMASAVLALQEPAGQVRLVAYVVHDPDGEADCGERASLLSEQVTDWQALYDNTYARAHGEEDASFNIVGWDSSYTREPIPAGEMLEWTERTVEEILELAPQRVLEIGVGTGLLLHRIAPLCELYRGTDFSPQVIAWLSEQLGESLPQVELARCTAEDFSGVGPRSFDMVLLNSVVQYFPDADYLARVLGGAVEAVADGGAVYVGDVRSLPLLEAFHASVELFKAAPSLPLEQLRQIAAAQRVEETELALDPGFFFALKSRLPRITAVEVRPKRGRSDNELTRFRYQVVLRVGGEVPPAAVLSWLSWEREGLSLEAVRRRLEEGPDTLALSGVPNLRVEPAAAAAQALGAAEGPETAGALRERLEQRAPSGVHPEDLLAVARELGYEAVLGWARHGAEGRFDVLFRRPGSATVEMPGPAADRPWSRLANNPVQGKLARRLMPALRSHLEQRLPAYMVPSTFVLLDELPLTPNGKIDRRALPAPAAARVEPGLSLAPRTQVEEKLAAVFCEVLKLDRLGVEDDFFATGGHSLLATQVISRIREAFEIELPLRSLFEAPTVAGMALLVEAALAEPGASGVPPLRRMPREAPLPLSFAQQRLWFIDQLEPHSPLYNVPVALRLDGPLHPGVLALCLGEIVRRHESLRTVFAVRDGAPVQVIRPAVPFGLTLVDLSELPPGRRETVALSLARDEASRPFDLARDLLLRCVLLRLAGEACVVALTMHHIASDGWSMGILVREVTALYEAFAEGRPSPLPELPVQYADFAAWQSSWLQGEILEGKISFWRSELAGLPALLELPTDRPRPAAQSYRGASRPLRLPAELAARIRDLGAREGATLFMVLLAGFQALLARYSGQKDLAVGSPVAGRNRIEIEGLIGFFVNSLVLRGNLAGSPSFLELLGRSRDTALAAYAHQDVPFEKLVQELAPERRLSHSPLFQVVLTLQNTPVASLETGTLRVQPVSRARNMAQFDLELILQEHEGGPAGVAEYATDLFDAVTIDRLIDHYEKLLTAALATPEQAASELPLLAPSERWQVLHEWNDTARACPKDLCIQHLFAEQVARTPHAVAVSFENQRLTYRELDERANRLAQWLIDRGVGSAGMDVLVALLVERSLEMIVALVGILKAGGAYAPLEPGMPPSRLRWLLDDVRSPVLLTQTALLPEVEAAGGFEGPVLRMDEEGLEGPAPGARAPSHPLQLAYVNYTSGSTGRPKGVVVPHLGVTRLVMNPDYMELGPDDVILQLSTYAWDAATWEIWGALLNGGRLVMIPRETVLDFRRLARVLVEERITALYLTTALFNQFVEQEGESLAGLSTLIIGGETASVPHFRKAVEMLPRTRIINEYGPTENTSYSSWQLVRGTPEQGPLPIGKPLSNSTVYVLDRELQPMPLGLPGELFLGGDGLARGYLGRPDLTAERFVPHPFATGERLYRTGDLGSWRPDGRLDFLGRMDFQVKIRGHRIEPAEVEDAIKRHEGVEDAVVVAYEPLPQDRRLVAYVVGDVVVDRLRDSLRERLPDYMVPAAFVTLAALPLTPTGKVDRKALPPPQRQSSETSFVKPGTDVERILAGLWAELLGLERVGTTDDFFALGGHSLLAVRLMARIEQTFRVKLPMAMLFEAPTVRLLAEAIQGDPVWRSALVRLRPGGSRRPLFLVHAAGGDVFSYVDLAQRLGTERPVYGLQAVSDGNGHLPTMEAVAAHYLESVREVQPEGPWLVAGWSSGAVMAYEMARQLTESPGGASSHLILFDPPPPPEGLGVDDTSLLVGFAALGGLSEQKREAIRERVEGLDLKAGLDRLFELSQAEGMLPPGVGKPWMQERLDLYSRTITAVMSYVPRPFGGRVTLFRASASLAPGATDLTQGWGLLARTEAHFIPDANHFSLLRIPALHRVVEQLKRALDSLED